MNTEAPGRPPSESRSSIPADNAARAVAVAEGLIYLASGLWPIVSLRTFEALTGPKADKWLVVTAGALISVIGASLCIAARRPQIPLESRVLGASAAGALATVDLVNVARGRLSSVYLLDAVLEGVILAGWGAARAARHA